MIFGWTQFSSNSLDFLMGIIGGKEDSVHVKEEIRQFAAETLKLDLSDGKTLIAKVKRNAEFTRIRMDI